MVQPVVVVGPPSDETVKGFSVVLMLGISWFCASWLWEVLHEWYRFDLPYNLIAGFYYYTIVVPLKTFSHAWDFLQSNGITPYSNLNFCLSVLGIVVYTVVFVFSLGLFFLFLIKSRSESAFL